MAEQTQIDEVKLVADCYAEAFAKGRAEGIEHAAKVAMEWAGKHYDGCSVCGPCIAAKIRSDEPA